MKSKPRDEPGNLLYRFYKKWVSSFVSALYMAGITAGDKDIHKARILLKKIFALLSFFEILEAGGFRPGKYIRLFKSIFREAGKVREIQVNIQLLEMFMDEKQRLSDRFSRHLEKELKKTVKAFTAAIVDFPVKKLRSLEKDVRNYCRELDAGAIKEKSNEFLLTGALKIHFLAGPASGEEEMHSIRKELKKMKAVASLLANIGQGKEQESLIVRLEKTEVLIGEWHDRVVLASYMQQFLMKSSFDPREPVENLRLIRSAILAESIEKSTAILPMVREIHRAVFGKASLKA